MVSTWFRPERVALLCLGLAAVFRVGTVHAGSAAGQVEAAQLLLPQRVGEWRGTPVPLDERTFEILETRAVATTEYRLQDGTSPIWVSRVCGFGKRAAYHPPEICLVGSRFEILERGPVTVQVNGRKRSFMRLVVAEPGGPDGKPLNPFEAWYWFTAGDRVTPNYYQQQIWLLKDMILGRSSEGNLLRVSTPIGDGPSSSERLKRFVAAFEREFRQ